MTDYPRAINPQDRNYAELVKLRAEVEAAHRLVDEMTKERSDLLDEVERLKAALKPFADWIRDRDGNYTSNKFPDACPLAYHPVGQNQGAATVGDLRRARAALDAGLPTHLDVKGILSK